uniref:Uncharacterized protein n=1 Tax=Anopheles farauti TaxID=69004 RepID=A0A182QN57_9DIPT
MLCLRVKRRLQTSHWNGRSPECVRMCRLRSSVDQKRRIQNAQTTCERYRSVNIRDCTEGATCSGPFSARVDTEATAAPRPLPVTFLHIASATATGIGSGFGSSRSSIGTGIETADSTSPCLRSRCRSQLDLVVNSSVHCEHLNGFWPVCVRMCRRSELDHGNMRWQYGQLTRFGAKLYADFFFWCWWASSTADGFGSSVPELLLSEAEPDATRPSSSLWSWASGTCTSGLLTGLVALSSSFATGTRSLLLPPLSSCPLSPLLLLPDDTFRGCLHGFISTGAATLSPASTSFGCRSSSFCFRMRCKLTGTSGSRLPFASTLNFDGFISAGATGSSSFGIFATLPASSSSSSITSWASVSSSSSSSSPLPSCPSPSSFGCSGAIGLVSSFLYWWRSSPPSCAIWWSRLLLLLLLLLAVMVLVVTLLLLLLVVVPLARTLHDHVVEQRVQVTRRLRLVAGSTATHRRRRRRRRPTLARLLRQNGVLHLVGDGASTPTPATAGRPTERALQCGGKRTNGAAGNHATASASATTAVTSSTATAAHQMMSTALALGPKLGMLLLDVPLHVGAQREPGGAVLASERALGSVAALLLLRHQHPHRVRQERCGGGGCVQRERRQLQRVVQVIQLQDVHRIQLREGVVEQLELLLLLLLLLLSEIHLGELRKLLQADRFAVVLLTGSGHVHVTLFDRHTTRRTLANAALDTVQAGAMSVVSLLLPSILLFVFAIGRQQGCSSSSSSSSCSSSSSTSTSSSCGGVSWFSFSRLFTCIFAAAIAPPGVCGVCSSRLVSSSGCWCGAPTKLNGTAGSSMSLNCCDDSGVLLRASGSDDDWSSWYVAAASIVGVYDPSAGGVLNMCSFLSGSSHDESSDGW